MHCSAAVCRTHSRPWRHRQPKPDYPQKMPAESPTHWALWMRTRTVGNADLHIYFLNTMSPVPTSFPIFQPFPLKPRMHRWKGWKYRWKRQRKGGKACRSQQWCWWNKTDSSYFQSFDLPSKIYWILCIVSQPAYKIVKSTWNKPPEC